MDQENNISMELAYTIAKHAYLKVKVELTDTEGLNTYRCLVGEAYLARDKARKELAENVR